MGLKRRLLRLNFNKTNNKLITYFIRPVQKNEAVVRARAGGGKEGARPQAEGEVRPNKNYLYR